MNALKIGLVSALALATALPALAQPGPYQPTQQYQDDQQRYQQDRADYQDRKDAYDASRQNYDSSRADYRAARSNYERRLADYQRARADYDARYGYGAYVRVYGAEPVWSEGNWRQTYYVAPESNPDMSRADYRTAHENYERRLADWRRARADYDGRYGDGAYARVYGPEPMWSDGNWRQTYYVAPAATYNGRDVAYTAADCRSNNNSAVTAGIIGALAGAALGSNVAAGGHRGDGAVLGAIVGGGIGASVGHANDKYKCDSRGPYYSYNDTMAYREASDFRSGDHDYRYYSRMRCRLAVAPLDRDRGDYRYVRVCPDRDGRYRITG